MTEPGHQPRAELDPETRISTSMASLYRFHFERDPDGVRTLLAEDVVVVVLRGSLTSAESRMVQQGHQEQVRENRLATQQASATQFRRIVEEATGRPVIAFTSAHDVDADVATEVFVLDA